MITRIKNESENPITVAFMDWGKLKWWDQEWEMLIDIENPLVIAPRESLQLNAPIPCTNQQFEERPSFKQLNETIPTYLQIRTKRRIIKDLKKSCGSPRYQNATFNVVHGNFYTLGLSREAVWAQKIVDNTVTSITILGSLNDSTLIIDKNGTPSLSITAHEKKHQKPSINNSNWI